MGQRFQVYVKVANNQTDNFIIGYHQQWSWGHFSLIRAEQLLKYMSSDMKEHFSTFKCDYCMKDDEQKEIVKSIIQINNEYNSFVGAWELDSDVCENPSCADNDDGALFIDTTGKKPKYCFFHPYEDDVKPLNANEYAKDYIPNYSTDSKGDKKVIKIFDKYLKKLSKYEVSTQEDLKLAFPKMFGLEDTSKTENHLQEVL